MVFFCFGAASNVFSPGIHQRTSSELFYHPERVSIIRGNKINPFLIAAKRWGNRIHTLLYAGPQVTRSLTEPGWKTVEQINTNLHYMIPGSRNFVGVELNNELAGRKPDLVVRPQLRLCVTDSLLVGIVAGIPVDKQSQRVSSFLRLIYEPGHLTPKPG